MLKRENTRGNVTNVTCLQSSISLGCTAGINFRYENALVGVIERIALLSSESSFNVHTEFLACFLYYHQFLKQSNSIRSIRKLSILFLEHCVVKSGKEERILQKYKYRCRYIFPSFCNVLLCNCITKRLIYTQGDCYCIF